MINILLGITAVAVFAAFACFAFGIAEAEKLTRYDEVTDGTDND